MPVHLGGNIGGTGSQHLRQSRTGEAVRPMCTRIGNGTLYNSIIHHIDEPINYMYVQVWLCGTVVERRSLAGELSLSCARPAADG